MMEDQVIIYFRFLVKEIRKALSGDSEMKKTLRGIGKQTLATVGGTLVGGLVAGPLGGAVCGNAAGLISYFRSHKYSSLVSNLQQLDDESKAEVVRVVQNIVNSVSMDDLHYFMMSRRGQDRVLKAVSLLVKIKKAGMEDDSSSSSSSDSGEHLDSQSLESTDQVVPNAEQDNETGANEVVTNEQVANEEQAN